MPFTFKLTFLAQKNAGRDLSSVCGGGAPVISLSPNLLVQVLFNELIEFNICKPSPLFVSLFFPKFCLVSQTYLFNRQSCRGVDVW